MIHPNLTGLRRARATKYAHAPRTLTPVIHHISGLGASGSAFGILVVILRHTTKTQVDPDFAGKLNTKRTTILRITLMTTRS
jgi:hypothetical protein